MNQHACLQVPEFRVAYTVTTDKLDTLYKKLKPKGVTMTALLAKAAGVALAKHPVMYAGRLLTRQELRSTPFPLWFSASHMAVVLSVMLRAYADLTYSICPGSRISIIKVR